MENQTAYLKTAGYTGRVKVLSIDGEFAMVQDHKLCIFRVHSSRLSIV